MIELTYITIKQILYKVLSYPKGVYMRIATEVKGYLTAPTPLDIIYAPYDLALDINDGLIDRGHAVDFYAPEGSNVRKSQLVTMGQKALASSYDEYVGRENGILFNPALHSDNILALHDQRYSAEMFRRATQGKYDVLHFHHPEVALPYVDIYSDVPVIYTMHDPIGEPQRTLLESYRTPNQWLVSISDYQRQSAPDLPYIATVYNGIDTDTFNYDPTAKKSDRLLFAGRIVPEKGVKEAVQVALESGSKLDIIGPVFEDSKDYFKEHIEPFLGNRIRHLGHIARRDLPGYFQQAKAFLMPIQWDEPFGLTMAEAMACGTPVIAFKRGSVPEIIANEQTGFIVDTVEEMASKVTDITQLSPRDCRERVLSKFSITAMVKGYESVYREATQRAV